MDLERRIQDILQRQSRRAQGTRGTKTALYAMQQQHTTLRAAIVFVLGLMVGVVVSCAPTQLSKMMPHNQAWRIRFAPSDDG